MQRSGIAAQMQAREHLRVDQAQVAVDAIRDVVEAARAVRCRSFCRNA
jgi:hypothetical protein